MEYTGMVLGKLDHLLAIAKNARFTCPLSLSRGMWIQRRAIRIIASDNLFTILDTEARCVPMISPIMRKKQPLAAYNKIVAQLHHWRHKWSPWVPKVKLVHHIQDSLFPQPKALAETLVTECLQWVYPIKDYPWDRGVNCQLMALTAQEPPHGGHF